MTAVLLTRPPGSLPETLDEYVAAGGYEALRKAVTSLSPADVVRIVAESDLRGRGGAGFPTGRKWELAAASEVSPKYVVANGGEHEPGSRKDRLLLSEYPHKVLEGIALCAYATGASEAWLYLIEDMTDAIESARIAIAEARAAGLLGERIPGHTERTQAAAESAFSLEVHVVTAPTTYVAGEETAALEVIEGKRAWPRKKPPYPGQSGLWGKPTTVNNVETLAHVPAIVRHGPAWYRGLGVEGAAGTMLFTLDERVLRPGVYEVPFGATFRRLFFDIGGGPRSGRSIRAFQPALSSAFLSADHLDLPMTFKDVKEAGSGLGCGGVRLLEEGECLVERTQEIAQFFTREQCGQCPACRMETNTLAAVLGQVREGKAGDYAAQIEKITSFTRGKGYCNLIEMAAAPVLSALQLFPGDFEHHARLGTCPRL
jgi:NADH:ubiquinone oxidoreductase subunit F (NADH-binding)